MEHTYMHHKYQQEVKFDWSLWCSLRSQIGYREKAREEASRGGSLSHRPDIALATEVSKLTSTVQ